MLETLSIVAYRQPITRPEIDDIRGVDCGPVLKTLLDRGLVRMIGKKEEVGRPILYGTTPEFLRIFSLRISTSCRRCASSTSSAPPRRRRWPRSTPRPAERGAPRGGRGADAPTPLPPEPDPEEDDELLYRAGARRRGRRRRAPSRERPTGGGGPDAADSAVDANSRVRLQQFLAQAGRRLAAQGGGADRQRARLRVNGVAVTAPAPASIRPSDRVDVDGRRVCAESPIYRLMLKPRACLATLATERRAPDAGALPRDAEPGLQVVAPLDFPAEGVVLLTTDGELAQAISKRAARGGPDDLPPEAAGDGQRGRHRRLLAAGVGGAAGQPDGDGPARDDRQEHLDRDGRRRGAPRALKAAGDLIRHSVLKISRMRLGGLSFEGLKMGAGATCRRPRSPTCGSAPAGSERQVRETARAQSHATFQRPPTRSDRTGPWQTKSRNFRGR